MSDEKSYDQSQKDLWNQEVQSNIDSAYLTFISLTTDKNAAVSEDLLHAIKMDRTAATHAAFQAGVKYGAPSPQEVESIEAMIGSLCSSLSALGIRNSPVWTNHFNNLRMLIARSEKR